MESFFASQRSDLNLHWEDVEKLELSDKIPQFEGQHGLKRDLSNLNSPLDFFNLLITPAALQQICEWTNNFQERKRNRKKRDSHEIKWQKIDQSKLTCFLGVLLAMPTVQKQKISDYWSYSRITGTPGIQEIFSRDEFWELKRNIRFFKEELQTTDPFYRVKFLQTKIITNTNSLHSPPKNLTLDESMTKFNGRSKYKVYIPLKPIKFGFKVYTVTASI